jgi:hypothetical protein
VLSPRCLRRALVGLARAVGGFSYCGSPAANKNHRDTSTVSALSGLSSSHFSARSNWDRRASIQALESSRRLRLHFNTSRILSRCFGSSMRAILRSYTLKTNGPFLPVLARGNA